MSILKRVLGNLILLLLLIIGLAYLNQKIQVFKNEPDLFVNTLPSYGFFDYNTTSASGTQASDVTDKVSPSVVYVYGVKKITQSGTADRFTLPGTNFSFDMPGTETQTTEITAGTGFFVDSSGYIVTNRHVVPDDGSQYSVTLSDGTKKPADIVYRDPDHDVAIIKISGDSYPVANLGDSSKLKVGDNIVSIGNAYGKFETSVSSGSVSGLNKTVVADDSGKEEKLHDMIQTTAQLYPGDSGGPTVDSSGNVVGINVATATDRDNTSFSIPINDAKDAISKAMGR